MPDRDSETPNGASSRTRRLRRVSGGDSAEGPFESIYHDNKPVFLVKKDEEFHILPLVTLDRKPVSPKTHRQTPYESYGYYEDAVPSPQELFNSIFGEFDTFLDLERPYKELLAACVMLSYNQEKVSTVPYLFLYGDNESGKTVAATLFSKLAYRPLYGISIPPADVYGYLGDEDLPRCIIEDEAQGLHEDRDKLKIYKAGYKKGAVVPRFQNLESGRFIKYYKVYGLKLFVAEEIPRVKGFFERLIPIPMTEGTPKREWTDATDEDRNRIRTIRDQLLKWRLATFKEPLPAVELPVKGRLKELWKPIISIVAGLSVETRLRQFMLRLQFERLADRQNSLEGHIVKVVVELHEEDQKPISFIEIWTALLNELQGSISILPHQMSTPEFGIVTKQKIGYRLKEILGGKSRTLRIDQCGTTKAYYFDKNKLRRIAGKYGHDIVTKLPSSPTTTTGETQPEVAETQKEKKEDSEEAPQRVGKLSNLVTPNQNVRNFVFDLRRNSKHSGEVPMDLFSELLRKNNVGFDDIMKLSKDGILKTSILDGLPKKPRYVTLRWVVNARLADFGEGEW